MFGHHRCQFPTFFPCSPLPTALLIAVNHITHITMLSVTTYLENLNWGSEAFKDWCSLLKASLLTALSPGCLGSNCIICRVALVFFGCCCCFFPTAYLRGKKCAQDILHLKSLHVLEPKAMPKLYIQKTACTLCFSSVLDSMWEKIQPHVIKCTSALIK